MPVPSNLFAFNNPSVACIVDCLLKSANVDDLPVEQATKFDLVINLNIAKALGVTIPSSLLAHLRLPFSPSRQFWMQSMVPWATVCLELQGFQKV
jgi:ABC transporter substrate binding protein